MELDLKTSSSRFQISEINHYSLTWFNRGSSKSPQFQTNRNDRHFSQIINGNADNSDNIMGIIDNTDNRQYRIAWVSFYYKLNHPILKHLCLLDIHAHFQ